MRLSVLLLVVAGCVADATEAASGENNARSRTVGIDIRKSPTQQSLRWDALSRAFTVGQAFNHNQTAQAYFTTLLVGTPPQSIEVLVDTGSAELWFLSRGADICSSPGGCIDTFDPIRSSSFEVVEQDGFEVVYTNNNKAVGDEVHDILRIGGIDNDAIVIDDLQFGLVRDTSIDTGILGLGYSSGGNESRGILDDLKSSGHIAARAYSLYLDDFSSDTGSLLFGGMDRSKFIGALQIIDVLPTQPGDYSHFLVAVDSIVANLSAVNNGLSQGLYGDEGSSSSSSLQVALDSGTTISYLPSDIVRNIWDYFHVVDDRAGLGVGLVDCTLATRSAGLTVDFRFTSSSSTGAGSAGSQGPVIKVPFREFILDNIEDGAGTGNITLPPNLNFTEVCAFGLLDSNNSLPILGQNFLRSAYVVHDLDHQKIGLAQANVNVSTPLGDNDGDNIVEITETDGIPTSATGVAFQGATLGDGNGGGDGSTSTGTGDMPTNTTQSGAAAIRRCSFSKSPCNIVLLGIISIWSSAFR